MRREFPGAEIIGCTTAGELVGDRMVHGAVVAIFLGDDVVARAASALIGDLDAADCVDRAFEELSCAFGTRVSELDFERHVGIVLIDGLSGAEERIMDRIGDLADVIFVGGSAGDDLKFRTTQILVNDTGRSGAAALLLLQLHGGFEVLKTQSFRPTGKRRVATAVDEKTRTVDEFDHRPALEAYAEAVGVCPRDAAGCFFRYPLGLMLDGAPFVRSPQLSLGASIRFYCQVLEGMELDVLEGTDIVAATRRDLEESCARSGPIQGLIQFNCILRTLQLQEEGRCAEYGALFGGVPSIGFSTYGEEYVGHINQTSTMLLLR
jgi:hypothetical protein